MMVLRQISCFEILKISNDRTRKGIMDVYQLGLKRVVEFGKANPKYDIPLLLSSYQQTHCQLTEEVDRQRIMEGLTYKSDFRNHNPWVRAPFGPNPQQSH